MRGQPVAEDDAEDVKAAAFSLTKGELAALGVGGGDDEDDDEDTSLLSSRMLNQGLPTLPESSSHMLFKSVSSSSLMSSTQALPSKLLVDAPELDMGSELNSPHDSDSEVTNSEVSDVASGLGGLSLTLATPQAAMLEKARLIRVDEAKSAAANETIFHSLFDQFQALAHQLPGSHSLVVSMVKGDIDGLGPNEAFSSTFSPLIAAAQLLQAVVGLGCHLLTSTGRAAAEPERVAITAAIQTVLTPEIEGAGVVHMLNKVLRRVEPAANNIVLSLVVGVVVAIVKSLQLANLRSQHKEFVTSVLKEHNALHDADWRGAASLLAALNKALPAPPDGWVASQDAHALRSVKSSASLATLTLETTPRKRHISLSAPADAAGGAVLGLSTSPGAGVNLVRPIAQYLEEMETLIHNLCSLHSLSSPAPEPSWGALLRSAFGIPLSQEDAIESKDNAITVMRFYMTHKQLSFLRDYTTATQLETLQLAFKAASATSTSSDAFLETLSATTGAASILFHGHADVSTAQLFAEAIQQCLCRRMQPPSPLVSMFSGVMEALHTRSAGSRDSCNKLSAAALVVRDELFDLPWINQSRALQGLAAELACKVEAAAPGSLPLPAFKAFTHEVIQVLSALCEDVRILMGPPPFSAPFMVVGLDELALGLVNHSTALTVGVIYEAASSNTEYSAALSSSTGDVDAPGVPSYSEVLGEYFARFLALLKMKLEAACVTLGSSIRLGIKATSVSSSSVLVGTIDSISDAIRTLTGHVRDDPLAAQLALLCDAVPVFATKHAATLLPRLNAAIGAVLNGAHQLLGGRVRDVLAHAVLRAGRHTFSPVLFESSSHALDVGVHLAALPAAVIRGLTLRFGVEQPYSTQGPRIVGGSALDLGEPSSPVGEPLPMLVDAGRGAKAASGGAVGLFDVASRLRTMEDKTLISAGNSGLIYSILVFAATLTAKAGLHSRTVGQTLVYETQSEKDTSAQAVVSADGSVHITPASYVLASSTQEQLECVFHTQLLPLFLTTSDFLVRERKAGYGVPWQSDDGTPLLSSLPPAEGMLDNSRHVAGHIAFALAPATQANDVLSLVGSIEHALHDFVHVFPLHIPAAVAYPRAASLQAQVAEDAQVLAGEYGELNHELLTQACACETHLDEASDVKAPEMLRKALGEFTDLLLEWAVKAPHMPGNIAPSLAKAPLLLTEVKQLNKWQHALSEFRKLSCFDGLAADMTAIEHSLGELSKIYFSLLDMFELARETGDNDEVETVVAKHLAPPTVFKGALSGVRVLKNEWTDKVFGSEGFLNTVADGVRRVNNALGSVYLKNSPELPGNEYAVGLLSHLIMGVNACAPITELLKVSHARRVYVTLASITVPGVSLEKVMRSSPAVLDAWSAVQYSQSVLMAMLVNPEDGKPDNFVVTRDGESGAVKVVCIDNDHAFVAALTNKKGGGGSSPRRSGSGNLSSPRNMLNARHRNSIDVTNGVGSAGDGAGAPGESGDRVFVKTILYCFDRMYDAIEPSVVDAFLALNPGAVIESWLTALARYNQRLECMFTPDQIERSYRGGSGMRLPFFIAPKAVKVLYSKMCRMQRELRLNRKMTHLELLATVERRLAMRYEEELKLHDKSPYARFASLTAGAYRKIKTSLVTKTASSRISSAMVCAALPNSIAGFYANNYVPEAALEELCQVTRVREDSLVASALDALYRGDVSLLADLPAVSLQEQVVAQYDWAILDARQGEASLSSSFSSSSSSSSGSSSESDGDAAGGARVVDVPAGASNEALADVLCTLSMRRLVIRGASCLTSGRLAAILKGSPELVVLELYGCSGIQHGGVASMAPHLEVLRMHNMADLRDVVKPRSLPAARYFPQLREILLAGNPLLQTIDLPRYVTGLAESLEVPNVRVRGEAFSPEMLRLLLEMRAESHSPSMEGASDPEAEAYIRAELGDVGTSFEPSPGIITNWEVLGEALSSSTSLTRLVLKQQALEQTGVAVLAKILRSRSVRWKHLALQECGLNDRLASELVDTLRTRAGVTPGGIRRPRGESAGSAVSGVLSILDLRYNALGGHAARSLRNLLRATPETSRVALRELNLRYNALGDSGVQVLADALVGSRLEVLNLDRNGVTYRGASALAAVLANPGCPLTSLSLFNNELGDAGVAVLASAGLANNQRLKSLTLRKTGAGADAASQLGVALQANTSLTYLDLDDNGLGDRGIALLADGLFFNSGSLRELKLQFNDVGEAGAAALFKARNGRLSLSHLDLGHNALGADGARLVAHGLLDNTALQWLSVRANGLGDVGADHMTMAITTSRTLIVLDMSANGISPRGAEVVAAAVESRVPGSALTELNLRDNAVGFAGMRSLLKSSRGKPLVSWLSSSVDASVRSDGGSEDQDAATTAAMARLSLTASPSKYSVSPGIASANRSLDGAARLFDQGEAECSEVNHSVVVKLE
ncbi:ribonuclease inhibitor [Thecamonas trahens ATCC 50062]|uniref:Ribonuclease inhibitor n=1 Tax=Thecamonas trahens ATCC 50062 TaxID=461836 RepID=A0A0L0DDU0_THETB|nr:ribonuclease inhibitor [Thecamonas trahens ATCC 50062]KNC50469.1 ribonuclease inhibitor [Thecamonas trahens ATCC 50062]|eukprot:XP_013762365.1 ribonuclease inhibitor [Thecamonas trahens ATCC 50062]